MKTKKIIAKSNPKRLTFSAPESTQEETALLFWFTLSFNFVVRNLTTDSMTR
jgi:hypothetical protein